MANVCPQSGSMASVTHSTPSTLSASISESNTISIWNNGKGIPVVEHKDEKMYVPALIFGHLLTSSNYDDEEKKVTGEWHHLNISSRRHAFRKINVSR